MHITFAKPKTFGYVCTLVPVILIALKVPLHGWKTHTHTPPGLNWQNAAPVGHRLPFTGRHKFSFQVQCIVSLTIFHLQSSKSILFSQVCFVSFFFFFMFFFLFLLFSSLFYSSCGFASLDAERPFKHYITDIHFLFISITYVRLKHRVHTTLAVRSLSLSLCVYCVPLEHGFHNSFSSTFTLSLSLSWFDEFASFRWLLL